MAYPAKLVPLNSFGLIAATQTAVIDKLRKLLLNEFLNLGHCLLKAVLVLARYVEVQGGVLKSLFFVSLPCPQSS